MGRCGVPWLRMMDWGVRVYINNIIPYRVQENWFNRRYVWGGWLWSGCSCYRDHQETSAWNFSWWSTISNPAKISLWPSNHALIAILVSSYPCRRCTIVRWVGYTRRNAFGSVGRLFLSLGWVGWGFSRRPWWRGSRGCWWSQWQSLRLWIGSWWIKIRSRRWPWDRIGTASISCGRCCRGSQRRIDIFWTFGMTSLRSRSWCLATPGLPAIYCIDGLSPTRGTLWTALLSVAAPSRSLCHCQPGPSSARSSLYPLRTRSPVLRRLRNSSFQRWFLCVTAGSPAPTGRWRGAAPG